MTHIDKEHCRSESARLNETNDCTVRACACAAQIDYEAMHEFLSHYGRKPRSGMYEQQYHDALRDLGFRITQLEGPRVTYNTRYVDCDDWRRSGHRTFRKVASKGKDYSGRTVRTLQRELTEGTYLVRTDGHVLCLRDGVVHDFTEGRLHRVQAVYKIEENSYE